uniref:Uncharacterized protein n=1 Tax=Ascaris lumbricoides TaxID=6252 RepID=A0A0M3HWT8_ASCLU
MPFHITNESPYSQTRYTAKRPRRKCQRILTAQSLPTQVFDARGPATKTFVQEARNATNTRCADFASKR